jgi:hypothetical protein
MIEERTPEAIVAIRGDPLTNLGRAIVLRRIDEGAQDGENARRDDAILRALWIPFGVNFGAACKSGVHTGGYLVDERDQLFFTGSSTTAGKGAMTLHVCSMHYSTMHIRKGKIHIKRQS